MAGLADLGSQFMQDLRYAARSLKGSPGFTLAAVLTIGLGVGVNTGIFSVLNAVAFRDLPAGDPDALLAIHQDVQGVPRGQNNSSEFSTSEYQVYRDRSQTLDQILAYGRMWGVYLENRQQIIATPVSCNYFDVLERPPQIGGGFSPANCASEDGADVAVITNDMWMNQYDGDPSILDRTVTINGRALQIVGVAPEGFAGIDIDRPSLFVPLQAQRVLRPDRNFLQSENIAWLNLVGRRADGIPAEQVQAELEVIADQIDSEQAPRTTKVTVGPASALSAPEMRTGVLAASTIVLIAFGLVLLIACSNVANLMLARADSRMRDTAIRLSLGATRGRLVRQLMTESFAVAVIGGLLGAVLSVWAFEGLAAAVLSALPSGAGAWFRVEPEPDLRVFGFAILISLLSGMAFGITPALTATRAGLRMAIDRDSAGGGRRARGRLQGALVGIQVAFSMMLIVTTALLLRGLYEAQTVDPAFDHASLIVESPDMASFGYQGPQADLVQRQAIESIRALPGVEDVAQAFVMPLEPRARRYFYRRPEDTENRLVQTNYVSANYFDVTGVPIVRGRAFTQAETAAQQPSVAILTESTARMFWPDQDPLGKTLVLEGFGESTLEVVGIARDIEVSRIGETDTAYIYTPVTVAMQPELQLIIRTALPAESLQGPVSDIFERLDPSLPVRLQPADVNLDFWARIAGLAASLSFGLGTLALVLASVGVFGVMSTVVGRRVREIGVRLALGAGRGDVLRLMLRKSMRPVVIGAAVGMLACFAAARLLSSLLFGIGALDPIAIVSAVVAVLGAGFLASAIPARKAMNVDPMTTLRYE